MWSVGVCLYALLCSNLPFDSGDMRGLVQLITRAAPLRPVPAERGPAAADLVGRLLSRSPPQRPSAADALDHEWLAADNSHDSCSPPKIRHLKSAPSAPVQDAGAANTAPGAANAAEDSGAPPTPTLFSSPYSNPSYSNRSHGMEIPSSSPTPARLLSQPQYRLLSQLKPLFFSQPQHQQHQRSGVG